MSVCAKCNVELTKDNCYVKSDGYLRAYCKVCHNKNANEYNKISGKKPHRMEKSAKRQRVNRKNPDKLTQIILRDSKGNDKKHNRENDLTKEFIENLIKGGCSYCGESKLRITVDRIDNSLGHLQSNVVSACIRCNLARGDMPHQAWLCLVPGIIIAKEKGLFGDWIGRFIRKI